MTRDELFNGIEQSAQWNVGVVISRKAPLPLDMTSVFRTKAEADQYAATNVVAYIGQVVSVIEEAPEGEDVGSVKLYYIDQNMTLQEIGPKVTLDGASIVEVDGKLTLAGFNDASAGAGDLPRIKVLENGDKTIEWLPINEVVQGATKNTITTGDGNTIVSDGSVDEGYTLSLYGVDAETAVEGTVPFKTAEGKLEWKPVYTEAEADAAIKVVGDKVTELEGWKDGLVISESYQSTAETAIATLKDIQTATASLAGAMHFVGVVDALPESGNPGDVVLLGTKEYVWDGAQSKYVELGDENIYAIAGSIKDADIAADAAIAQSKIAASVELGEGKSLATDLAKLKTDIEANATAIAEEAEAARAAEEANATAASEAKAAADTAQETADANAEAITDLQGRADALEGIVGATAEDGLRKAVADVTTKAGANESAITDLTPRVSTAESNIADINAAIETLRTDLEKPHSVFLSNAVDSITVTEGAAEWAINHGLNSLAVCVSIFEASELVFVDVIVVDENNITLKWNATGNEASEGVYKVMICK